MIKLMLEVTPAVGRAIMDLIDTLTPDEPVQTALPVSEPEPEQTAEPEQPDLEQTDAIPLPTIEDVRKILAQLTQDGKPVAKMLQESFGVAKLSQVPREKYPELLKKAEGL